MCTCGGNGEAAKKTDCETDGEADCGECNPGYHFADGEQVGLGDTCVGVCTTCFFVGGGANLQLIRSMYSVGTGKREYVMLSG